MTAENIRDMVVLGLTSTLTGLLLLVLLLWVFFKVLNIIR